jgi:hypothetical protein
MEQTSTWTSRVQRLRTLALLVVLLTLGLAPLLYSGLRLFVLKGGGVNWTAAGALAAASCMVALERRSRRRFPRLLLWFAGVLMLMLVASVVLAIALPPPWTNRLGHRDHPPDAARVAAGLPERIRRQDNSVHRT